MDCSLISFCDKTGFNITCNVTKQTILDDLIDRFGINPLSRRTDVLSDRNKNRCGEAPAFLHLQTTGTAYIMFFTRINYQQVALLIDRKINGTFSYPKMVSVHLLFSNETFDGTVFTGELIKGFSEWMFLVDDVLAVNGKRIGHCMFRERYSVGNTLIKTKHRVCRTDMFSICMKRFFQTNRLKDMLDYASYMPYKVKGISMRSTGPHKRDFFVPVHVKQSTAKSLFLGATSADDAFTVHEKEDGPCVGNAYIPNMESSHYLKKRFEGVPYGQRVLIPCEWNGSFKSWQPVLCPT